MRQLYIPHCLFSQAAQVGELQGDRPEQGWHDQFGEWVRRRRKRNVSRGIRKGLSFVCRLDTEHVSRQRARGANRRLPWFFPTASYFTEKTLTSAKVVLVEPLPIPPLRTMGLARFADFERGNFDGITYLDTFFLKPAQATNEAVYFHELVHVVQWRLLGPDRFLFLYANGLECFGYRQSPLEAMAYDAEATFASSLTIFDVENIVAAKLGL
jgi:hypothetical protein